VKYAFMSFSTPDLTLDGMLTLAQDLGYSAIEPRSVSKHAHGVEPEAGEEQRGIIRRSAEASGIDICCIATSCRYADPGTVAANVEDTHRFIDLAGDIGTKRLRIFGGKLGEGVSRAAAIDGVAGALRAVASHAEERDVVLCLETHDDWCDPAHVAAVLRKVDHTHIAVNWDILHPVRTAGYTMIDAYEALKPWLRHVHFHDSRSIDGELVMVPVGTGICNHRDAVALLQNHGYDEYLSGEWINWEPFETHLPRELATMKSYE
jgi:sugar phosphate isomerase/epimerase